jgi:hypothetical protein
MKKILSTTGMILLSAALGAQVTKPAASSTTVLGIHGTSFTLNGKPTFLLGFSYYGALGAQLAPQQARFFHLIKRKSSKCP